MIWLQGEQQGRSVQQAARAGLLSNCFEKRKASRIRERTPHALAHLLPNEILSREPAEAPTRSAKRREPLEAEEAHEVTQLAVPKLSEPVLGVAFSAARGPGRGHRNRSTVP